MLNKSLVDELFVKSHGNKMKLENGSKVKKHTFDGHGNEFIQI